MVLSQVPLFPESASTVSDRVDTLYFFLVAVFTFFTIVICILILTFGIKYRRGSPAKRTKVAQSFTLEIAFGIGLLTLTMVMFAWGAKLFYVIRTPPSDAIEINVVGKQWMWKVQHPNGRSEINELHIPVNRPVQLQTISEDVIHSFFVPTFRVKQDVLPGYYGTLWFEATKTGEYHLFCAEYCGTEHSVMRGTVYVMEQADYAEWLDRSPGEAVEVTGRRLFERFRCDNCHKEEGGGIGPALAGLTGSIVPLANGSTIIANRQYLRDSIRDPARHVVAGYRPVMPAFRSDQLSETQIAKITAYIRSLSSPKPERGTSGEGSSFDNSESLTGERPPESDDSASENDSSASDTNGPTN